MWAGGRGLHSPADVRAIGGGEEARGQTWRAVPGRLQKRAALQFFVPARNTGDRSVATETAAGAGWGFQKGQRPFCPARERFFPKSGGRVVVAEVQRTRQCHPRRKDFTQKEKMSLSCPQKRPIVRPRRMRSMQRGQRHSAPVYRREGKTF
ncbi:hypothetical protein BREVNS_2480 [Brevinematales bacterium NS]|nr:hypothetical protein BREVNS_2480 [Brevinematales bacterium NS]